MLTGFLRKFNAHRFLRHFRLKSRRHYLPNQRHQLRLEIKNTNQLSRIGNHDGKKIVSHIMNRLAIRIFFDIPV
jgi:hypothetical protein